MDEDKNTSEDELFNTSEDDSVSPDNSTEEKSDKPDKKSDDEKNEEIKLDEPDPKEEARKKFVDAFYKKMLSGDKTLDDLPKSQKWMRPFLEDKLEADKKAKRLEEEHDIDTIVDRKLAEKEAKSKFSQLKETLNDMKLSKEQKTDIQEAYKELRQDGLDQYKALKTATRVAGVKDVSERKLRMTPPHPSTKHETEVDEDNLPYEDRIRRLAELTDPTSSNSRKFQHGNKTKVNRG